MSMQVHARCFSWRLKERRIQRSKGKFRRLRSMMPNHSLKLTPNGIARWSGRIRFAHFMRPAQRALPLGAA